MWRLVRGKWRKPDLTALQWQHAALADDESFTIVDLVVQAGRVLRMHARSVEHHHWLMVGAAYADGGRGTANLITLGVVAPDQPGDGAKPTAQQRHQKARIAGHFFVMHKLVNDQLGAGAHRHEAAVVQAQLHQGAVGGEHLVSGKQLGAFFHIALIALRVHDLGVASNGHYTRRALLRPGLVEHAHKRNA